MSGFFPNDVQKKTVIVVGCVSKTGVDGVSTTVPLGLAREWVCVTVTSPSTPSNCTIVGVPSVRPPTEIKMEREKQRKKHKPHTHTQTHIKRE